MTRKATFALFLSLPFLVCLTFGRAQETKPAAEDRWEPEIRKFEEQDQKSPPPTGANLFVGSSSIRMWKLGSSFPNHACINRGFGGSHLGDTACYAERIVIPCKPQVVVLYAGDNDIASGKSPITVRDDYRIFRDKIQKALPETRIIVIGVKPSPSRWKLRDKALEANRLLQEEVTAGKNQTYVDVWKPMLGDDEMPRADLFLKDNLHMNETGYMIWQGLIEPHLAAAKLGKVEFFWAEGKAIAGVTQDKGVVWREGDDLVYPHIKPILTNQDFVKVDVDKTVFGTGSLAMEYYTLRFQLTDAARKRLAETCDADGDGLLIAMIDGGQCGAPYYLKSRDEKTFVPFAGMMTSKAKVDLVVATIAQANAKPDEASKSKTTPAEPR